MADEDRESKTEEATEKRVRDAIEKGNIPSSREAPVLASFIAIFIAGSFLLAGNVIHLRNSLTRFIDDPGAWRIDNAADAVLLLQYIIGEMARVLVPVVLLLFFAGMASAMLQNPLQFVLERITPQWSRISPMKGFKRIFGLQGLVEFFKALFKFTAVGVVGFLVLKATQTEVLMSMFMEPVTLPDLVRRVVLRIFAWTGALVLVLVAADVLWSRFSWRRDLRMTKQEVKEEHKQAEGDPHIRARIRSIARDRARRRMMAAVPRATVIVTNPTHYAVALRYVREEGGAPMVLAKGRDLIALKIREIGEANDVPIVEDKPLARSLYESVEVDQFIPPQFYRAVAEIIYYLHVRKTRKPASAIKT
jgi:flagellar biosynthetic protein FlhB